MFILTNTGNHLKDLETNKSPTPNTRLCALAAEVHFAGFAPAFTLSLGDSERSRKPPMPIASVVRWHSKKRKKTDLLLKNL
jgi:hypothetical protein